MKFRLLCVVSVLALGSYGFGERQAQADDTGPLFGSTQPAAVAPVSPSAQKPATASGQNNQGQNGDDQGQNDSAKPYPVRNADLNDANAYKTGLNDTFDLSTDVNKVVTNGQTSAATHTITLNGKQVTFTARAGHLIAYAPAAGTTLADGTAIPGKTAEAAIFYTSYTRDDLPKKKRPVTFFWNGGPGSASIWLHMGSWGPMRLQSNAPDIPASDYSAPPASFPFIENSISLLDESDIVFVDPPGTGLSTAITSPGHALTNAQFWGTDADAQVVTDFITAYINKYNRQSSPKYLYGESYGGIRTPIVANLLVQAGTTGYAPDPTHQRPKVVEGFILNSPLLNYNTNCQMTYTFYGTDTSCAGYTPNYFMVSDYFKASTARGNLSQSAYQQQIIDFLRQHYMPALAQYIKNGAQSTQWKAYVASTEGKNTLAQLATYSGLTADTWAGDFNMPNVDLNYYGLPFDALGFPAKLRPQDQLGRYDGRMHVPQSTPYSPDDYINTAYANEFATYLPNYLGYKDTPSNYTCPDGTSKPSCYNLLNGDVINNWQWTRANAPPNSLPESITDVQSVLIADPDFKMMILHGYEDLATPGFQTRLDLEGVNLQNRIPIFWFEGGHMIYNTESSRTALKQTIDTEYQRQHNAAAGSGNTQANIGAP